MDNDEANTLGIKIPAYTVADIKLYIKQALAVKHVSEPICLIENILLCGK